MFNKGEWVIYRTKRGKRFQAFVLVSSDERTTVEVFGNNYKPGQPYEPTVFNVLNEQLTPCAAYCLPHEKDMLVDLALATNDEGWFKSLVGSESVIN